MQNTPTLIDITHTHTHTHTYTYVCVYNVSHKLSLSHLCSTFPDLEDDKEESYAEALFPFISMVNHSCEPNAEVEIEVPERSFPAPSFRRIGMQKGT